ncbi:MAG: RNA polymerase sigma-70 factor [Niabella sp.]
MKKIDYIVTRIGEHDDQLAFNELYRHYLPGLLPFAVSILKDRQQAEEAILDVFFKLWENRKALGAIKGLSNYIYVATKHTCISYLRKQKIIFTDEIDYDFGHTFTTPESSLISRENMALINAAVQSLPPKCSLIFRLIREECLKYEEVAKLLNVSVKTVEAQMTIANKRLVEVLKKQLPEYRTKIQS